MRNLLGPIVLLSLALTAAATVAAPRSGIQGAITIRVDPPGARRSIVFLGDGTRFLAEPDSKGVVRFKHPSIIGPQTVTVVDAPLSSRMTLHTYVDVPLADVSLGETASVGQGETVVEGRVTGQAGGRLLVAFGGDPVWRDETDLGDAEFERRIPSGIRALPKNARLLAVALETSGLETLTPEPRKLGVASVPVVKDHARVAVPLTIPFTHEVRITVDGAETYGGEDHVDLFPILSLPLTPVLRPARSQVRLATVCDAVDWVAHYPDASAKLFGVERGVRVEVSNRDHKLVLTQAIAASDADSSVHLPAPTRLRVATRDASGRPSRLVAERLSFEWEADDSASVHALKLEAHDVRWRVTMPGDRRAFTFFPLPPAVASAPFLPSSTARVSLETLGGEGRRWGAWLSSEPIARLLGPGVGWRVVQDPMTFEIEAAERAEARRVATEGLTPCEIEVREQVVERKRTFEGFLAAKPDCGPKTASLVPVETLGPESACHVTSVIVDEPRHPMRDDPRVAKHRADCVARLTGLLSNARERGFAHAGALLETMLARIANPVDPGQPVNALRGAMKKDDAAAMAAAGRVRELSGSAGAEPLPYLDAAVELALRGGSPSPSDRLDIAKPLLAVQDVLRVPQASRILGPLAAPAAVVKPARNEPISCESMTRACATGSCRWRLETLRVDGLDGASISAVVGPDGHPRVAFARMNRETDAWELWFASWNGARWQAERIGIGTNPALALVAGQPQVRFMSGETRRVATRGAGAWSVEDGDGSDIMPAPSTLKDSAGVEHAIRVDGPQGPAVRLDARTMLRYRRTSGGTTDECAFEVGFRSTAVLLPAADGEPALVFGRAGKLVYAR